MILLQATGLILSKVLIYTVYVYFFLPSSFSIAMLPNMSIVELLACMYMHGLELFCWYGACSSTVCELASRRHVTSFTVAST